MTIKKFREKTKNIIEENENLNLLTFEKNGITYNVVSGFLSNNDSITLWCSKEGTNVMIPFYGNSLNNIIFNRRLQ